MVSNPIVLFVFLAPFAASAALIVLRVVRPRTLLCAVSLGAVGTFTFVLLSVNFAGILLRSFGGALVAAWIVALASAPLIVRLYRRRPAHDPLERPDRSTRLAMIVVLVPLVILVGMLALFTSFHDEIIVTGHLSVTGSMARGVYPPTYLAFPDVPYKYHYGFDVLAAVVARLGGAGTELSVDVVAMALFVFGFLLAWSAIHELTGRRLAAWLGALWLTLGGGMAVLLASHPAFKGTAAAALRQENVLFAEIAVNPNMMSYFFQHPFALGVPLFVAAVYLYVRFIAEERRALLALLAPVMGALALAQICLFAILCCGLFVFPAVAAVTRTRPLRRLALPTACCLLAGLALARLGGGFFVVTDAIERAVFVRPSFGAIRGDLAANLLWMLASGGWTLLLLVPAAVLAMARRRPLALFASVMALGALLVPHIFYYDRTSDIIKFLTVSYVAATLAVADVAALLAPRLARVPRYIVILALTVTGIFPGVAWLGENTRRALDPDPIAAQLRRLSLEDVDRETFDWLIKNAGSRDVLVTDDYFAAPAASYTGLRVPYPENAFALGFPLARCRDREDQLFIAFNEPCLARLAEMGADWLYMRENRVIASNILKARRDVSYLIDTGRMTMRSFGPPDDRAILFHFDWPPEGVVCLCNLHAADFRARNGARATGDDLIAGFSSWKTVEGAPFPEDSIVDADGRKGCLRAWRGEDGLDERAAVALLSDNALLRSESFEIQFEGRAEYPHFGEVVVNAIGPDGEKTRLRWYRWTARQWRRFRFFTPAPDHGKLELALRIHNRGGPGEVLYANVSIRPAIVPPSAYPE